MPTGGQNMSKTQGKEKIKHKVKMRQQRYTKVIRIPVDVAKHLELESGDILDLEVVGKTIRLKKAKDKEEVDESK